MELRIELLAQEVEVLGDYALYEHMEPGELARSIVRDALMHFLKGQNVGLIKGRQVLDRALATGSVPHARY